MSIEVIPPNEHIIEMTKEILAQNREILRMNADLLRVFRSPVLSIENRLADSLAEKEPKP